MLDDIEIIIPTYNRSNELSITLKILLDFGFTQSQIYVYDDSSTEDTKTLINQDFSSINYHKPTLPGLGVIVARNHLWSLTTRPFVLSLDDDSAPQNIETILNAVNILKNNQQAGVFAFNIHEGIQLPPAKEMTKLTTRPVRLFTACGCIFTRDLIESLKYYAWGPLYFHGEELDCSLRATQANFELITCDDLVVHHRVDWTKRNLKVWGKYGKIWRSASGFSANLIIALKYYPIGIDILFIVKYTLMRFYEYLIKRGHFLGFILGLLRFILLAPKTLLNMNKLGLNTFKNWIILPTK